MMETIYIMCVLVLRGRNGAVVKCKCSSYNHKIHGSNLISSLAVSDYCYLIHLLFFYEVHTYHLAVIKAKVQLPPWLSFDIIVSRSFIVSFVVWCEVRQATLSFTPPAGAVPRCHVSLGEGYRYTQIVKKKCSKKNIIK